MSTLIPLSRWRALSPWIESVVEKKEGSLVHIVGYNGVIETYNFWVDLSS